MSDKTLSGLASKLDEKLLNAREKKENSLNDDSDDGLIIDSDEKSSLLDKLVEVPPETRNLSLFGAMIQLILSIVGSGCLAVPFAFSRVGIVTGIVCIFLIGLVGIVSSTILILCEETSYKDLAEKSMGQVGRRIIEFTIIIAIYANMVSYLIVIYNIIISIFSLFDPTVPSYVYLLTTLGWTLFVLLPMSVPCRLSLLVWTSFVGAITTYVLLGNIIAEAVYKLPVDHPIVLPLSIDVFLATSIFTNSFVFQLNIGPVLKELKNPTFRRKMSCCVVAVVYAVFVYSLFGVFGFLAYGSDTQGNVLNNLHLNRIASTCSLLCFGFTISNNWAVLVFPFRSNLVSFANLVFPRLRPKMFILRLCLALGLCLSCFGIAVTGVSFSFVLGFVGSTADMGFTCVFPALFFLLIYRNKYVFGTVICVALIVLGLTLSVIGIYSTVVFRDQGVSHLNSTAN